MDVRNGLEGLRTLLGVNQALPAAPSEGRNSPRAAAGSTAWDGDHATLSGAASEMAHSVSGDGVRSEKVESVRAALAAGSYHVSDAAVASKLVSVMLAAGQ